MTISILRTELESNREAGGQNGFSLAEVIIASGLSGVVLAGILSTFLLIGRTGYAASGYSEMEAQSRRAIETFGADARKATDIRWNNSQSVTLFTVTSGSAVTAQTYAYDSSPGSPTFRCFYRMAGDASSGATRTVLARDVEPDMTFQRFKLEVPNGESNIATNDLETKQLQIKMRLNRTRTTIVAVSQTASSAVFLLRNKRVAN